MSDMLDLHGDCAAMLSGHVNASRGCSTSHTELMLAIWVVKWLKSRDTRMTTFRTIWWFFYTLHCTWTDNLKWLCLCEATGKFAFVSHTGSSVIDYETVWQYILLFCSSYSVNESVLSPHMCLELSLSRRERKLCRESIIIVWSKIIWDFLLWWMFISIAWKFAARWCWQFLEWRWPSSS